MYILARDFGIKPWETDGTNIPKYEDIQALLGFKRMEIDAQNERQQAAERENSRMSNMAGLKQRAAAAFAGGTDERGGGNGNGNKDKNDS